MTFMETVALGGMYSHFTVLLKDVVCLFRIYVNQSGNKGLAIAQTARRESVSMLAWTSYGPMMTRFMWSKWTRLEKTGSIQYFGWSPNTSATFRPKPREKPLLSGPLAKTGALNASEGRDANAASVRAAAFFNSNAGAAAADRNL